MTGCTITRLSNFNSLSATSFSAGTINSGGTEISTLFLNANGGTKIQPGLNTYTGGTFSFPTVNISALTIDHISVSANSTFNSFSATSFSAGTMFSGSNALDSIIYNIASNLDNATSSTGNTYVQNGLNTYTGGTQPRPNINISSITVSNLSASGNTILGPVTMGATIVNGDIEINGNVNIRGTASTFDVQSIQVSGNTILLNFSGSHISAQFGGLVITSGQTTGGPSSWLIDTAGNWSASTGVFAPSVSATTFYSAGTDVAILINNAGYSNQTHVQPGVNISTGGTFLAPVINIIPSPVFTSISANTITGNTIYSANTELGIIINQDAYKHETHVQNGLNTYTGGTSLSPTINISALTIQSITVSGTGIYNTLSGVSFTAGTINSGATEISTLFLNANGGTKIQPGLNTYTGGTFNFPTVNISAATLDNITITGVGIYKTFSGVSITATTLSLSSTFQLKPSGTTGYHLISDSQGFGYWQPNATLPSGSTELAPAISILNTPPGSPNVGDTYLVGTAGTGAWSASSNDEAIWTSASTWSFIVPVTNNTVFITTTLLTYLFNGSTWIVFPGVAILQNGNTLGNTMNIGTNDNNNIQFKISGNTAVNIIKPNTATTQSTVTVNYLVVAGGGSGGAAASGNGGSGGGGAGGWLTGSTVLTNLSSYTITIGSGATAPTSNSNVQGFSGGQSSFGAIAITFGGGGGGSGVGNGTSVTFGLSGGSGGGSGYGATAQGGAAVVGQGKSGGTPTNTGFVAGSGGGGAAQAGLPSSSSFVGGVGGSGLTSNISGIATIYAGGGAGGSVSAASLGGAGGGGFGGIGTGAVAAGGGTNGLGGGGGGSYGSTSAGAGGSGVVIISYTNGTGIGTGGIITTSGGKTIHTFLTSSTFTFIATQTLVGVGDVPTAMLDVQGSSVSNASLRIRSGQTVTTLNNGDIWNDGTYLNLNGVGYTTLSPSNFNTTYFTLSTGTTLAAISGNSNTSTVFVQSPSTAGNRNGTASIILQQSIGTGTGTFLLQKNDFITGNIAGNIPNSGLASVSSSAGLLFSGSNIYFVTSTAGSAYAMFFNNNGLRIDAPATISNNSPSMLYLAAPNGNGTVAPNKGLHIRVDSCNFLTTLASGSTSANTNSNSFSIDNFSNNGTPATVSDAANVFIDGAPTVGGSLVATRSWSLYVNTGNNVFGGKTIFGVTGQTPNATVQITGGTYTDTLSATTSFNLISGCSFNSSTGGTNATLGTATLSSGTIRILSTGVKSTSLVFVTIQKPVNPGAVYVSSMTGGTGFDLTSTSNTDGSLVAWNIENMI